MPRKLHNALTPMQVKNLGPGRHADGGGLYLRVQKSGPRSWLFRYILNGKARDVGIGSAGGPNAISLAKAREIAREMAVQATDGELLESKRAKSRRLAALEKESEADLPIFKDVANTFMDLREGGWRNPKHRAQWRSTLAAYVYPALGDMLVSKIETSHILAVLEPIWSEKPETASRVRGRIEAVLDAAKVQGLRSGENPARWRGHLSHIFPKASKAKAERNRRLGRTGNHPALPYDEFPAFMAELRTKDAIAALALEFTILTAARTNEVLQAKWDEIDLAKAHWTIPASRMKAGKEHRVPLSSRVLDILEAAQKLRTDRKPDAFVFPASSGGAFSNMAMTMVVRRMHDQRTAAGETGYLDPLQKRMATVHGFRSTFRDWAAECTSFSHEVCEMALAHEVQNKSEAAYRRGDLFAKRRDLMEAWAEYSVS